MRCEMLPRQGRRKIKVSFAKHCLTELPRWLTCLRGRFVLTNIGVEHQL